MQSSSVTRAPAASLAPAPLLTAVLAFVFALASVLVAALHDAHHTLAAEASTLEPWRTASVTTTVVAHADCH